MYKYYSHQGHALSPWWVGPALINKASPCVYQLKIPEKRGTKTKWFHSSQMKSWKGTAKSDTTS